jgi:hypothetical protein
LVLVFWFVLLLTGQGWPVLLAFVENTVFSLKMEGLACLYGTPCFGRMGFVFLQVAAWRARMALVRLKGASWEAEAGLAGLHGASCHAEMGFVHLQGVSCHAEVGLAGLQGAVWLGRVDETGLPRAPWLGRMGPTGLTMGSWFKSDGRAARAGDGDGSSSWPGAFSKAVIFRCSALSPPMRMVFGAASVRKRVFPRGTDWATAQGFPERGGVVNGETGAERRRNGERVLRRCNSSI